MRTAAGSVRESVRLPARFTSNCAETITETSSGFLGEADGQGASMSTLILEDDELTDLQVELFTAGLADALAGTLWPTRRPGWSRSSGEAGGGSGCN